MGLKKVTTFLIIFFFAIFASSCSNNEPPPTAEKPVIKLLQREWLGSKLNNMVAKILLEEKLGYQVEIVDTPGEEQFEQLKQDQLHANLEIWPSGWLAEIEHYIQEEKSVEYGGELGVLGRIGWFIPSYLLKQHPELESWESLKNPELVQLFQTAETDDSGMLLSAPESWTTQDTKIIQALELPYELVHTTSETDLIERIEAAYRTEEPLLFYFWTPHFLFSKVELAQVKFPSHEGCDEQLAGSFCYYPVDIPFKTFWPGLRQEAPVAYQFLKQFNYTNEDQISMMGLVEIEDKTVEEAARIWIQNNRPTWELWMP